MPGLYAADPFEGTWKLNESKSKLTRGTDKDTKIVYNSRLIPDTVAVTTDGVEGNGTPFHSEWKGKFDGKDYAITGDPDANMRSYKKMNDRTLSMTAKKGGEVVLYGLIISVCRWKKPRRKSNLVRRCDERLQGKKEKGFRNKAVYDKE